MMSRNTSRYGIRRLAILATAVLATAGTLLSSPVAARGTAGECVSIEVEGPLLLPDGSVHEMGSLTLCHSIRFSPVTSLHKTFVNGMPLALLRSRAKTSEISGEQAAVVYFNRTEEGYLQLFGYVVPGREASTTYVFAEQPRPARGVARNHREVLTSPSRQPGLVAVAAPTP